MKSCIKPRCRKQKCRGVCLLLREGTPEPQRRSLPFVFSVALEGVHETLGFYRRQFEDVSSNLLGPKSSKILKLSDHLHLTYTMTQARGTLLSNSSRIFAQPRTLKKLFPTICGKGIFLIHWSQGKCLLRVLIVLSQHWCELTRDSTIVSNSAPSLPQPPKEFEN